MRDFTGKTLIVTGASLGIGRALALILAEAGVNLVLGARGHDELNQVRDQCLELGAKAVAVPGDCSRETVAEECLWQALDMGEFYGFIHAAGVLAPGPYLWELEKGAFDQVMNASVRGAYMLARACYPNLLETGGVAVFFGSGGANIAQPGIAAYCAAKAAEEHLVRQLAAETDAVTACVYRPGVVETRMQSDARSAEGGAAGRLAPVFQGWEDQGLLITPEQAAQGLVRLLEGDWKALHGQTKDIRDEE